MAFSFVGCGNSDEYDQKLYEYYVSNLSLSESIVEGLKVFTNIAYEMDAASLAMNELETEKIFKSTAEIKDTTSAMFDILKDPPNARKDAYAIAERIYKAHLGITISQENAYKDAPAGQAMTYVQMATDYLTDYSDALTELKDYFDKIGFKPKASTEAS